MESTYLIALLLLKFCSIFGQGVFDPCYFWEDSVYAGGGMCFKLSEKSFAFEKSVISCESEGQGGFLAEPRTQRQLDTVRGLMSGIAKVMLGGWYPTTKSNFEWLSDHPEGAWQTGTRCLALDFENGPVRQKCGRSLQYICQIYAGNPCDTFLPGAEYYDTNCFLPVNQPMNLENAAAHCEARIAKVVEPNTDALINHMKQFAGWNFGPENTVWLGLTHRSGAFTWQSTGEKVTKKWLWARGLSLWTSYNSTDSAVVMNGTVDWAWDVVPDTSLAHVICQRDMSGECSGVFSSNRCLNFYHGAETWILAKAACEEKGAYLAEPISEILHLTIARYRTDENATVVFLGASDVERNGQYVWDYSKQPLSETYTRWGRHQPDNGRGEYYLEFGRWLNSNWNNIGNEKDIHSYICEKYIPTFTHSYVVVFPQTRWGGAISHTLTMLSLASFPNQKRPNYVQITTFPTGDLQNVTLFRNDAFQYEINLDGLWIYPAGVEEKYLRVISSYPLDVHFFLWRPKFKYACSCLLLGEMSQGNSKAFFIPPGQKNNKLAIVSTEDAALTMNISLSTSFKTFTVSINNLKVTNGNMVVASTALPKQYQSLFVDSTAGTTSAQVVHSTGALNVFRFTREYGTVTMDTSCEQMRPVSMIGSDYVTFPSLPMSSGVTDHYTIMAVYNDTVVKVFDPKYGVTLETVTLQWPGDVYDLALPASGFYHVTGTNAFYLNARLTGPDGLCSLTLMDATLYRASYQFAVVGPLSSMDECYVVTIVDTQYKEDIYMADRNGTAQLPDQCQDVYDTSWSGCYFHLAAPQAGELYTVQMTNTTNSTFGAYLFCTRSSESDALCFPLGITATEPEHVEFDFDEYLKLVESKHSCTDETTTAAMEAAATAEIRTNVLSETTNQLTTQYLTTEQPTTEYVTTGEPTTEDLTSVHTTEMISTSQVENSRSLATAKIETATTSTSALGSTESDNLANMDPTPTELPSCIQVRNVSPNITLTSEEVEKSKEEIIAHLRVKQETLSSVKRSKISVPDQRVSSATMGMGGVAFIGLVMGLVVVSDIGKIVHDLRLALRGGFQR